MWFAVALWSGRPVNFGLALGAKPAFQNFACTHFLLAFLFLVLFFIMRAYVYTIQMVNQCSRLVRYSLLGTWHRSQEFLHRAYFGAAFGAGKRVFASTPDSTHVTPQYPDVGAFYVLYQRLFVLVALNRR